MNSYKVGHGPPSTFGSYTPGGDICKICSNYSACCHLDVILVILNQVHSLCQFHYIWVNLVLSNSTNFAMLQKSNEIGSSQYISSRRVSAEKRGSASVFSHIMSLQVSILTPENPVFIRIL